MSIEIARFASIDSLPVAIWDEFAPRNRVCLESGHLRAIQDSRINDLSPYYLIGYDGATPVGIAYCFALDLDLSTLGNEVPRQTIATIKSWYPGFMKFRVLEVGVVASLGSTIVAKPAWFPAFAASAGREFDQIGRQEDVDFVLIRDISAESYAAFRPFEDQGYQPILGFATTRMNLHWNDFADYLAALTSKRRYNILNDKLQKLERPGIAVELVHDYREIAPRLGLLWNEVSKRSDEYQHEHLNEEYFRLLSTNLPERSHVIVVRDDGEIVAFALCLTGDEEYSLAYVGLDYLQNEKYALYFNLLILSLKYAIEQAKKVIDFGITSYSFKGMLGCEFVANIYLLKYLRHPRQTKALADMFEKAIRQPDERHHVFAADDEVAVARRHQVADARRAITPVQRPDVFNKLRSYVRANVLRTLDVYGFFPAFEGPQDPLIDYHGRLVAMLGTNSYMGLGSHPEVCAAAQQAISKYGTGCSGSPLMNGTLDIHNELARSLARFMQKEDALLFSTGYQANLGVVSTLVGKDDVVIMDERDHASLIDGARLSRCAVLRFRHNDMSELEQLLGEAGDAAKLVLVDSLFSMEGTVANIPEIVRLSKRYGARIMLDESHAIGVLGDGGRGAAEMFGLLDQIDIVMGTFSKSLAAQGGFVVGDAEIIDSLRHQARSHMFSASLAPSIIATVQKALEIVIGEPQRRQQVVANARYLSLGLEALGYDAPFRGGAIIPLFVGDELLTLALFYKLFAEGVFVNPVIAPAVPRGAEMLRISLMATCTQTILDNALKVFARIRTEGFPRRAVTCDGREQARKEGSHQLLVERAARSPDRDHRDNGGRSYILSSHELDFVAPVSSNSLVMPFNSSSNRSPGRLGS